MKLSEEQFNSLQKLRRSGCYPECSSCGFYQLPGEGECPILKFLRKCIKSSEKGIAKTMSSQEAIKRVAQKLLDDVD